jgi:CBS domain-containing protein
MLQIGRSGLEVPMVAGRGGGPMRVSEQMTSIPSTLAPDTPLLEAARRMAELEVPALPVCDGQRLVGILTERALVFGAVQEDSDGDEVLSAEGRVDRAMLPAQLCHEDDDLEEVLRRLAQTGAGHLVVLDANDRVTGMLSVRPSLPLETFEEWMA